MRKLLKPTLARLTAIFLLFPISFAVQKEVLPHKPVKMPWDLAISDIIVETSCKAVAVVKNTGTVHLPDWAYGYASSGKYVILQVGKESGPSTGVYLWACDPGKALKPPGGQITYGITILTDDTPVVLWAHIDSSDKLPEINETNNRMTKRFTGCPYLRLPDLVVEGIRLVEDCKIQVTVRNDGRVGVPDSYYNLPNAVTVQLYKESRPWGGMILKMFDPSGQLKSPGGRATKIWFPSAANLRLGPGYHHFKTVVDGSNILTELSETNNSLTSTVYCR